MINSLQSLPSEIWIIAGVLILILPVIIMYIRRNFEISEFSGGPPWVKFVRKGKKADTVSGNPVISTAGTHITHADNIIIHHQAELSQSSPSSKETAKSHNLPQPDYSRFIGREKEIKQVMDILRPYPHSQYPIVTIDGIGGIGKSALALEVANRFLHNVGIPEGENFDAIIWTSAKMYVLTSDGIQVRKQALRTLDDIYTTIAIVLRSEDITRAKQEEQSELVRRALTQQRTLLIVDNLETVKEEAVINFLRELPAPTKAIVTTRHRIDVAYPIRLLDMLWEDAKALINQECTRKSVLLSEIEKEELYRRTQGVPIAIVWSIGQAGLGYGIKSVLSKLEKPDSDIAHFCFDESVSLIREKPAHKLLMALALFASGATRENLGDTTEFNEAERDEALVDLEKLSLVNKHGNFFSMLPLTRTYSLAELDQNLDFAYSVLDKRTVYLSKLLRQADNQFWIQDQETIMKEGENFLNIFEWSLAHNKADTALSVIKYAILYLQYVGRRAEALNLANFGISLAAEHQALSLSAWLSVDAGWIHSQQGSHQQAIICTQNAVRLFHEDNNELGVIFANCFLAQTLRHAGELQEGEKLLQEVVDKSNEFKYAEGITIANFEFGKIARERGDWINFYNYLSKSISNIPPSEYSPDIFTLAIQGNYGTAALRLGYIDEAKEITSQVIKNLDLWREFGLASKYTARMYMQYAEIEISTGHPKTALEYCEKALEISKTTKDDVGISQASKMIKKISQLMA
jgi:LuxR family glucitol operon transcriptional activator